MDFILRLWKYVRVYKSLFCILLAVIICNIGLNLTFPLFTKAIIDTVLGSKNFERLNILAVSLLGVFLLRSMVLSIEAVTAHKLQNTVVFRLRNLVYYKIQSLSLAYFEKEQKGPIVSKVISDVDACQQIVTGGFVAVAAAILNLCGSLFILIKLNWKLTLVTMIPMPFIAILIYSYSARAHASYRQVRKKMAEVTSVLQENIFGMREIKTFTQEGYEMDKFSLKGRRFLRINMLVAKLWATYHPLIVFFSAMGTVFVLWYGGSLVIRHEMSIGELVAFLGYLGIFYAPINQLNQVNNVFQHSRAAGERIFEILDTTPEIRNSPNAIAPAHPLDGEVEFKNVSFGYEKGKDILHNVSFSANAGETIAIVGPSGSGKTTLISLIPRFYDVTSGKLVIDGRNIDMYKISYLRSQIGMVLQEPFLFTGTVTENIAFGKMNTSMQNIVRVAKAARAHEFITELPEKYDTEIGEQGCKLSGGQRQRIAIARALLKDPPILVLDEATSSVDTETEKFIQEALEILMKGRTSFVIAHRLSTIRNASRIIVLKKGEIVEIGSHKELLDKEGLYFYLYKIQFGIDEMGDDISYLMEKENNNNKAQDDAPSLF